MGLNLVFHVLLRYFSSWSVSHTCSSEGARYLPGDTWVITQSDGTQFHCECPLDLPQTLDATKCKYIEGRKTISILGNCIIIQGVVRTTGKVHQFGLNSVLHILRYL